MTPPACRVCGGRDVALHSVSKDLPVHIWPLPENETHELLDARLYLCGACGHLQLQDYPHDFLARLYAQEAFNVEDAGRNVGRKRAFENALGTDIFAGKRLLDIGGGRNSFAASYAGAERWVSDFSVTTAVRARATRCVEGDFLRADLPESYFDLISLFHCLEHFNEPADVLLRAKALLRPGGLILAEVPDAPDVIRRMPYYAVFHQHPNLFSLQSLDSLFARAGFRRRSLQRESGILLAAYAEGKAGLCVSQGRAHADALRANLEGLDRALRELPLRDPARTGLYGAGGSAGLLLANFPWLRGNLSACFDRDPRKHGRRIPGGLPVLPPEDIARTGVVQLLFLFSGLRETVAARLETEAFDVETLLRGLPPAGGN